MTIVVGLDVHRAQITYDALNTATGEVAAGRIAPADRATLRTFLRRWAGEEVEAAVEATTGWRFVVEELQHAGAQVQLAEPADTTAARGPKRRAKTDKRDARHLRVLLLERRLPQSWIAPEHILELRALVRLRKTLVDQRTEWLQRIHAVLFHHGVRLDVMPRHVAVGVHDGVGQRFRDRECDPLGIGGADLRRTGLNIPTDGPDVFGEGGNSLPEHASPHGGKHARRRPSANLALGAQLSVTAAPRRPRRRGRAGAAIRTTSSRARTRARSWAPAG
jgi:hypothetical protein